MSKNNIEQNKSMKRRLLVIYLLTAAFSIACMGRIIHLSQFSGEFKDCVDETVEGAVADSNCNCIIRENKLTPLRGEIFDDMGRVLVSNNSVFDVVLDGRYLKYKPGNIKRDSLYLSEGERISWEDQGRLKELVKDLAREFHEHFSDRYPFTLDYYERKLGEAILQHKNVTILSSKRSNPRQRVTSDDTAFIKSLPVFNSYKVKAASFPMDIQRIMPYGELAKRTLGTFDYATNKKSGLEETYDYVLGGDPGSRKYMLYRKIRVPIEGRIDPTDGKNIQTTINLDIQYIVYQALMDKLLSNNAQWGTAIVMETATGEIKAITNLTRKGTEGNYYYTEQFNYALRHECEPGSTFKLASLLAYLEKTPNDTTPTYLLCGCEIINHFGGRKFQKCYDSDSRGSTHRLGTVAEIFQRSYNEANATMIFKTYPNFKSYLDALRNMGILDSIKTQLGTIPPPTIRQKATDRRTYYSATFGAGFNIAPIQTLTYYNAIANNGKMVKPLFVKSITDKDGIVKIYDTEVLHEQICSEYTVKRAQKYLRSVVTSPVGTARKYANFPVEFAGKTGTRDIWDPETKSYLKSRNSASFCGYFPYDNPRYTVIVYLYNIARMSGEAVDVFATIAQQIMNIENFASLKEFPVSQMIPTANSEVERVEINEKNWQTQLIGLDPSTAIFELSKLGYSAKIEGKGVVKRVEKMSNKKVKLVLGAR